MPPEVGVLRLWVHGSGIEVPRWGANGRFRVQSQPVPSHAVDKLSAQIHCSITEGPPINMEAVLEISVSDRSREEGLGHVIPLGWKPSWIRSYLPGAMGGNLDPDDRVEDLQDGAKHFYES